MSAALSDARYTPAKRATAAATASKTAASSAPAVGPLEVSFVRALYALVLLSTLTLWMAEFSIGAANPLLPLLTAVACWFSYHRLSRGKRPILGRWLGNLFALGALLFVLNSFLLTQSPNVAAIGSLLNVLLWVKLLQEKRNRDFVQVLLLSVSQMVVAAVLTQALWFGAAAAVYLMIATWTLLLFHFKREGDGDYHPLKQRQVDWRQFRTHELISRAFVGMMLFTLLLTALGTILVFVSIPRVTTNWLQELMPVQDRSRSGLSDQVRLGSGGRLDSDNQVALYVEFEEKPEFELLYRAVAQTGYDPDVQTWWMPPTTYEPIDFTEIPAEEELSEDAVRIRVTDNQMPRRVKALPLPGTLYRLGEIIDDEPNPDKPYSVTLTKPESELLSYAPEFGVVETEELWRRHTIQYEAVTQRPCSLEAVREQRLARMRNEQSGEIETNAHIRSMRGREQTVARWTEENHEKLRDWLREEVPELELLADEPEEPPAWTVADAKRVMEVLNHEPYYYTTERESPPEGMDPTLNFLVNRKGGHCEYFASALAMLLLVEGYEARVVTGFAGGSEWIEDDGKPVNVVLNAHAHAWVEVRLESGEWVTFNPSPSIGAAPEPLSAWELWIAALQYRWRRHVVDFDLAQQLGILEWLEEQIEAARDALSGLGERALGLLEGLTPGEVSEEVKVAAGVMIVAVPAGLLWLAWFKLRKRRRRKKPPQAARRSAFRPMQELLAAVERARVRRAPSATPQEFLERSELSELLPPPERELFLRCYHAARFGAYEPSTHELERLQQILEQVREAVRSREAQAKASASSHSVQPD